MFFKQLIVCLIITAASAQGAKFPTADDAVRKFFPDGTKERETILLTKSEQEASADSAGQKEISALITRFVVSKDGKVVGYAYFNKHLVRTLPQTLVIGVDTQGKLIGIEVLAFREPAEYKARAGWFKQFHGKSVEDQIRMKKNIDGITGATLTARAVTQCARRVLSIHEVLEKRESK